MLEKFEMKEFTSASSKHSRRRHFLPGTGTHINKRKHRSKKRRRSTSASSDYQPQIASMLFKTGICVAACALVLLSKWAETPLSDKVDGEYLAVMGDESDAAEDETTGRLKFVYMPSIIEVFAGKGETPAPVEYSGYELFDGGTLCKFVCAPGGTALCIKKGYVKTVGEDPALGKYIVVEHGDDLTTTVYGLKDVIAEEGQPLNKGDTVGIVCDEGAVYLAISKGGIPQNISSYIELDSKA